MPALTTVYPVCTSLLPLSLGGMNPQHLPEYLEQHPDTCSRHPFLPDLARIERLCYLFKTDPPPMPDKIEQRMINPALELLSVQWSGLSERLTNPQHELVEKEGHIDSKQAAKEGGVPVGTIDDILYVAAHRGLLLAPKSLLVRAEDFPRGVLTDPDRFSAPTFTLQWHITQVCDLHCRHCYDRSDRKTLGLKQAIRVLDDLYSFCQQMHVFTQVTFTGGNPLLYPHFNALYKEAADRGFMTAVLGNPMPKHRIEEMLAIQKPEFYQVSLEGLREHNDYIRGQGHFDRVFDFLDLLKELKIYSMVMLTLTRANMDQVLELAELLRDRVDLFTFNRLAMVGEGADLASAPPEDFPAFLESYMEAAQDNPCMSLKDNFFNLIRHKKALPYVGGCAGYGCGAGSSACNTCEIRPVCGGCLAVSYGFGKDIFNELDPYCFR